MLVVPFEQRLGGAIPNEQDEQIDPDSKVSKPAEALQCTDLTDHHTGSHEDNKTDDEADALFRNLGDRLAIAENEDRDCKEKLNCLEEINAMACPAAENAEEAVCISLHRVLVGIHVHEDFPELEPRIHGETTKYSVEGNTWAITHLSESPTSLY